MNESSMASTPAGTTELTVTTEKPRRVYSTAERVLLLAAITIGVLFDRLTASVFTERMSVFYGVFWLAYLVAFYVLNREGLRKNVTLWVIAALAALLCVWFMLYGAAFKSSEFAVLNVLVLPCVLMAHAQLYTEEIALKQMAKLALAWLSGFFIKPFSSIGRFFGAAGSTVGSERKSTVKSVALALLVSAILLAFIVPLLIRADRVFEHYIGGLFRDFEIGSFAGHIVRVFIAAVLFYSFLWNSRYNRRWLKIRDIPEAVFPVRLVSCIVLGAVVAVYVLFCAVQFTYLFARAGLPSGLTYSEYAREGFAQIVTVCIINLLLFGFFISGGEASRLKKALLAALLLVTAIILASGFVRLRLYIDVYGMTWLRLLSAWFIIYLAAAIAICAVRMARQKLPAVMTCALALLLWFTVLGYANTDRLIEDYNTRYGYGAEAALHSIDNSVMRR